MHIKLEGGVIKLRGLHAKSSYMVSSYKMQKMLKKGADGFVAQLFSLEAYHLKASTSLYL